MTFAAAFLRVLPIHPHFRFWISVSIGACLVLSHSCLFETTSGHLMPRMFLRHLLVNVWSLWVLVLVTRQVSAPYSRTDFTLVLKIRIFLWSERAVYLHIGRRVLKACLALFIRHSMSLCVPPSLLNTLPRYTNLSTSLMSSWCSYTWSCCLLFTLMTSVFPMLICRPVFSASAATRHSFSCASCCLWERRLVSSEKSRSSSCFVKVHWMPVLLQSTTIRKIFRQKALYNPTCFL